MLFFFCFNWNEYILCSYVMRNGFGTRHHVIDHILIQSFMFILVIYNADPVNGPLPQAIFNFIAGQLVETNRKYVNRIQKSPIWKDVNNCTIEQYIDYNRSFRVGLSIVTIICNSIHFSFTFIFSSPGLNDTFNSISKENYLFEFQIYYLKWLPSAMCRST